mgnify:CR=1 FL=1
MMYLVCVGAGLATGLALGATGLLPWMMKRLPWVDS